MLYCGGYQRLGQLLQEIVERRGELAENEEKKNAQFAAPTWLCEWKRLWLLL